MDLVLIETFKHSRHSVGGTMKGPAFLILCALFASSVCTTCPNASNVGIDSMIHLGNLGKWNLGTDIEQSGACLRFCRCWDHLGAIRG